MTRSLTLIILVASLGLLGEGHGAIVHFPSEEIAIPNTYAGVSVDLETGNFSTSLNGLAGGDANFFLGGSRISNDAHSVTVSASWQPLRTGTGNTDAIVQLPLATTIDASTNFYATGFGASGQINPHMGTPSGFTDGLSGYLGYALVIDDPGDPGNPLTVYGWARVTFEDNDGVGTLHEWAYEDTGSSIEVGAVPEAGSLTFLVIGSFGWFLRRR